MSGKLKNKHPFFDCVILRGLNLTRTLSQVLVLTTLALTDLHQSARNESKYKKYLQKYLPHRKSSRPSRYYAELRLSNAYFASRNHPPIAS